MTSARLSLCLTLAAAVAACSDGGPVAAPGTRTVTLVSPSGDEGAALLTLVGEGVGPVEGVGETEVHRSDADGVTRLVLFDLNGGTLAFRMALADTSRLPAAYIEEVAGPDDQLRVGLAAYRLELGR